MSLNRLPMRSNRCLEALLQDTRGLPSQAWAGTCSCPSSFLTAASALTARDFQLQRHAAH